jgi:hypothetical protein
MKSKTITEKLNDKLWLDGGFSVNTNGQTPTTGYMVGKQKIYKGHALPSREAYEHGFRSLKTPSEYLGGWYDERSKIYYLDLCDCFATRDFAERVAREREELAIYDIESDEEIRILPEGGEL